MRARRLLPTIALLAAMATALAGCAALDHGFLAAAGPVAAAQRALFARVGTVLLFVAGPVLVLVPAFAWYFKRSHHRRFTPTWVFSWPIEGLIWIPPVLIVIGLSVVLWRTTHRLDPYRPVAGGVPVEIGVVALERSWLFLYPDAHVASVGRLVVPVGRPVRLTMTSATVMQSLMIPRAAGQVYVMPGMKTRLNLRIDAAGRYRGENTQYNGTGFPHDRFEVLALPQPRYGDWLADIARTAPVLDPRRLAAIRSRGAAAAPQFYASAPAGLLDRIIAETIRPGPPPTPTPTPTPSGTMS